MKYAKVNFKKMLVVILMAAGIGLVFPYANYAVDKTYQSLKLLVDILELVKENYVEEVEVKDLVYGAAYGIVSKLDDFSQFMEPETYKRVKSDTEGEFGGIGIRVESKDGWLMVVTPLPNTPAFKTGLYPGDRIIKIEGESTRGMLLEEAVKRLRGKPGTEVNITIAREPEKKGEEWITRDVTITRALIKIENTKFKIIDEELGIAYLKIVDFTGHVVEDVKKDLEELKKKGMKSLIIDLRYNPGGLLMASVDIAKLFLGSNKMIVFTKGREGTNYQEFRANSAAKYGDLPLVVLINRYSASASEIVSGAFKDNRRALIIGERSFGKASVQSIVPLFDGSALRLTIAKYYTPSGKSIQKDDKHEGGIESDIEIKISKETENKLISQMEDIFYPDGKKPGEKKEKVKDEALERAVEMLKAKDVLVNLNPVAENTAADETAAGKY